VRRVPGYACGAARLFLSRRGVGRRGAEGCKPPASGWRVRTGSRDARAAALGLWALAPGKGRLGSAGARLMALWEGFAQRRDRILRLNPYPARRAPRRFLVVRVARERCGARLCVPLARRGSFGLGAAVRGVWRGRRTLRQAVGVCALVLAARRRLRRRAVGWSALAPAARTLLRCCSRRLPWACARWARLARGSWRLFRRGRRALRRWCHAPLTSKLPYPGRRAPSRFLVVPVRLDGEQELGMVTASDILRDLCWSDEHNVGLHLFE
jgi:hypothetical protein